VELYKRFRLACAEGMSARATAKHFNISRGTVDKVLAFSVPPGYLREKPIKRPKLDGFTEFIDAWLEADKAVHRKLRHPTKRIWERLSATRKCRDDACGQLYGLDVGGGGMTDAPKILLAHHLNVSTQRNLLSLSR
jgi:hypothetical protein